MEGKRYHSLACGTDGNICIVALSRPANIEIKEAVSVVYKSLKKNTVPSFSVTVVGGIARWGNDWDVCAIQSTSKHGESHLPLKSCDDGLDFKDSFWPPEFAQCLTHLPEDVTGGAGSNTIQVGNIVELNITGKLVDGNCYPLL